MNNPLRHFIKKDKKSKDLMITPIMKTVTSMPPKPAPTNYNVGSTMSKIIRPTPQSKIIRPSPQPGFTAKPTPQPGFTAKPTPQPIRVAQPPIRPNLPSAPSQMRRYEPKPKLMTISETQRPTNSLLR